VDSLDEDALLALQSSLPSWLLADNDGSDEEVLKEATLATKVQSGVLCVYAAKG
jgi:hypothetical protein